ncbi:hypothetical protein C8R44DRAFT_988347 [Mycena epipterygia]|nr:hypothetical protein C8R44DRAFT_988347 [Mycena epipterygia]
MAGVAKHSPTLPSLVFPISESRLACTPDARLVGAAQARLKAASTSSSSSATPPELLDDRRISVSVGSIRRYGAYAKPRISTRWNIFVTRGTILQALSKPKPRADGTSGYLWLGGAAAIHPLHAVNGSEDPPTGVDTTFANSRSALQLAMSLPLTEAQLLGNWLETLTYGMYFVTCGFCARTLLCIGPDNRWRKPSEIRGFILGVGIALFVVATFDVVIGLLHNLQAFVFYTGGGGAGQVLADILDWINIARTVTQVIQMILGDFVLIHRCYIVYSRRWKVLIPSLILYLGGVAMGIKLIEAQVSLNHVNATMNSPEIRPWWFALFCITVVQNTLTTGLLIWRIWRVERQIEKFRVTESGTRKTQAPLRRVIRVIAESGLAYTLMVFMTFVVGVCNSNLIYPLRDATHQATGIVFNVIIMRSSPSRDEQFTVFEANERAAAEKGALTRLRFSSRITGIPASIDDGAFTVQSMRGPVASPHEDCIDEHKHI